MLSLGLCCRGAGVNIVMQYRFCVASRDKVATCKRTRGAVVNICFHAVPTLSRSEEKDTTRRLFCHSNFTRCSLAAVSGYMMRYDMI